MCPWSLPFVFQVLLCSLTLPHSPQLQVREKAPAACQVPLPHLPVCHPASATFALCLTFVQVSLHILGRSSTFWVPKLSMMPALDGSLTPFLKLCLPGGDVTSLTPLRLLGSCSSL